MVSARVTVQRRILRGHMSYMGRRCMRLASGAGNQPWLMTGFVCASSSLFVLLLASWPDHVQKSPGSLKILHHKLADNSVKTPIARRYSLRIRVRQD